MYSFRSVSCALLPVIAYAECAWSRRSSQAFSAVGVEGGSKEEGPSRRARPAELTWRNSPGTPGSGIVDGTGVLLREKQGATRGEIRHLAQPPLLACSTGRAGAGGATDPITQSPASARSNRTRAPGAACRRDKNAPGNRLHIWRLPQAGSAGRSRQLAASAAS